MRHLLWAVLLSVVPVTPAFAGGDGNLQAITGAEIFQGSANLNYGIAGGYDFDLGGKGFIGVQATVDKSTLDGSDGDSVASDVDLGAQARIGLRTGEVSRAYLLAGLSSLKLDTGGNSRQTGLRAGIGYEQGLFGKALVKLEYRFSTYGDAGSRNQILAGFGFRF
jgi:opacity protein-like surface antigen